MSPAGSRWLWLAVCCLLVSLPFLGVDFIPSTDLPQHLGQLRLFEEAISNPEAPLTIQWWTPYSLVYLMMAVPWTLFEPITAGRVAVLLLVLLQVAATHWVAARFERPQAGAVLALSFFFSNQLYWGFLNFLFGWVAFMVWLIITRRSSEEARGWRAALLFLGGALLLYCTHALWFAFGLLWFWVEALVSRRRPLDIAWRFAGQLPVVVAALFWYDYLKRTGFGGETVWALNPLSKLNFEFLVNSGLGGLRHSIEPLIIVAVLFWIVASLVANRRRRLWGCDPHFLALTVLLLVVYMAAPDKHTNTIRFSARWLPFVFISALMTIGKLPLRPLLRAGVPLVLLATHMVTTAAYWKRFEEHDLQGLREALAVLPEAPRVVGLSYLETTPYVIGRPYLQSFAWAYVLHGGELNFSFGYFSPSLVVYEDLLARIQWTWGLEWFPKRVRRSDFRFFDYALIAGDDAAHMTVSRIPELEPVSGEGPWRLYRTEIGPETPQPPPVQFLVEP